MKLLGLTLAVCLGVLSAAATNPYVLPDVLLADHHRPPSTSPPLALDEIERIALADNPEIHVAAKQLAVVEARVPAAGALDDPIFMYRGWGVPFSQPVNFNAAQNMFMLGQTFPWPGKRNLRSAVARSDVD